MGAAGREWMLRDWALPALVQRLRDLLAGDSTCGDPAPYLPSRDCAPLR